MTNPRSLARQLLAIIHADAPRLARIDHYINGYHDDPYLPESADDEYHLLAARAVSNWMPLLVETPAQALYVDGFRPGKRANPGSSFGYDERREIGGSDPEWDHWQKSRLDERQGAIYRGALRFGHAFTVTEFDRKRRSVITKGLSAMKTAALYEDPANDLVPFAALTVTSWPKGDPESDEFQLGKARMWDGKNEYPVTFKALNDLDSVKVHNGKRHGASECPVTRFAASVDLEGRTVGVVEPMIVLQNRINQTMFDLLVTQTYTSFTVRTATGMAPPMKMQPVLDENGVAVPGEFEPVINETTGMPELEDIRISAKRLLLAEDPEARFGSLEGTPLDGLIASLDMSIRHLAAISQTPPHHLLGQIANLSAEALQAAETSLARKIESFRAGFGESWERVLRLAAELNHDSHSADDWHGEVLWRDMEARSLAASADALAKFRDMGLPIKALINRIPGITQSEKQMMIDLMENDPEELQAQALKRAFPDKTSSVPVTPAEE